MGKLYLKALGRSGLGTVPSTPPLSSSTGTGEGLDALEPPGIFLPYLHFLPTRPYSSSKHVVLTTCWLGLLFNLTCCVFVCQLACKSPQGRKSFQYTRHLLNINSRAKLGQWGVSWAMGEASKKQTLFLPQGLSDLVRRTGLLNITRRATRCA